MEHSSELLQILSRKSMCQQKLQDMQTGWYDPHTGKKKNQETETAHQKL